MGIAASHGTLSAGTIRHVYGIPYQLTGLMILVSSPKEKKRKEEREKVCNDSHETGKKKSLALARCSKTAKVPADTSGFDLHIDIKSGSCVN